MFLNFYDHTHAFTPLAIVRRVRSGNVVYRTLHVFGLRLAYWTCDA